LGAGLGFGTGVVSGFDSGAGLGFGSGAGSGFDIDAGFEIFGAGSVFSIGRDTSVRVTIWGLGFKDGIPPIHPKSAHKR
jgi:hypothetical protein